MQRNESTEPQPRALSHTHITNGLYPSIHFELWIVAHSYIRFSISKHLICRIQFYLANIVAIPILGTINIQTILPLLPMNTDMLYSLNPLNTNNKINLYAMNLICYNIRYVNCVCSTATVCI